MDNLMLNNKIYLEGKIVSELEFSHEMYGEGSIVLIWRL